MKALTRADKRPKPITTRSAVVEDIRAMWEIDQKCFEPGVSYTVDVFYYHLFVNCDPAFVALDGGEKVVGFVLTSKKARGRGQIVTIDVLQEWRRGGIGAELMALAERALALDGASSCEIQVAVDNKPAIEFYRKLDYRKRRLLKHYYGREKHAYLYVKNAIGETS